jgi:hypothetical protein
MIKSSQLPSLTYHVKSENISHIIVSYRTLMALHVDDNG